ncbi:SipW-dependent-type signal peptide-containing protein [Candidatus Saccharibacteria bacterium]|nr:SipW-dependent-type signal peptide-containing protein [Candidatus Saccharibacteria bacterium]
MYKKIRIATAAGALAVICIASSSGTLSYFTDTVETSNSFAVGRVASELHIYKDTLGSTFMNSDYDEEHPIEAGKPIPYYLEAENTGNIDAYQRFRIAVPINVASVINLKFAGDLTDCDVKTAEDNTCDGELYKVTYDDSVNVEDTPTYAEYYIESKTILAKDGKTEPWPTTAIVIENGATNEDLSKLTCGVASNNCTLGIKVYSDTIQTYGFKNVGAAFADFKETY